jgi:hypothetical protein
MKTLIEGGWVVAFNSTGHEVYENGSVVYENDRIVHAGGPYTGTVDLRLSARGKLVSPGFINTHVHTTGNGGDYMLHDMVKNDYRTASSTQHPGAALSPRDSAARLLRPVRGPSQAPWAPPGSRPPASACPVKSPQSVARSRPCNHAGWRLADAHEFLG